MQASRSLFGRQTLPLRPTAFRWLNSLNCTKSRKPAITFTPPALTRLRSLLEKKNKEAVQIQVEEKGCAGLTYNFRFHDSEPKGSETAEHSLVRVTEDEDTVAVFIDPQSLTYLLGTEVDWVEEEFQTQFVFKNPNAKRTCGCGRSFAT